MQILHKCSWEKAKTKKGMGRAREVVIPIAPVFLLLSSWQVPITLTITSKTKPDYTDERRQSYEGHGSAHAPFFCRRNVDGAEDLPRQVGQYYIRNDCTDRASNVYPQQGTDLYAMAIQPDLLAFCVANRNPSHDAEGDGKSPGDDDDGAEQDLGSSG